MAGGALPFTLGPLASPCDFPRGLPFGFFPTYPTADHLHKGQDWLAPAGSPCWFREAGVVVWAQDTGQLGNYVALRTATGVHWGLAHLRRIDVAVGQQVAAGDVVGLTGGVEGEPGAGLVVGMYGHLHEERWVGGLWTGVRVDPMG